MKCLACRSANLIEVTISDNGGSTYQTFTPKDKSKFLAMFGFSARKILNFTSVHCGSLQYTVDFTDEDRQRYFQFEGEQPNVIERLNAPKLTD